MLSLGIGATTAIFSLFYQVLLEPLPVPEPERLVNITYIEPDARSPRESTSYPMFRDLEAQQAAFTGIAAHSPFRASLSYDFGALNVPGELVSGSYFQVLGLRPSLGRLIGVQDEPRIGESPVVVLSHDLWRNRFGSDPDVIGTQLTVNGQSLTVIGVAPERFQGTHLGIRAELFVPLTMHALLQPGSSRETTFDRRFNNLWLAARLRPDIGIRQATTSLNTIYSRIRREVDAPQLGLDRDELQKFLRGQIALLPGLRGWGSIEGADRSLTVLLGLTLLVVAIICVNVANLLFARGTSRGGEMAVRESLGASRGRLLAQLLTEAAVPAAIGGALSLPIAAAMLAMTERMLPPSLADGLTLGLRPAALLFAAVVTVATMLLSSLAPALRASRTSPARAMKGYASQALGGRGATRIRNGLATAQIAFSMVLLVLGGLFAQSLANIARIDLGVDVESLVSFKISPRLNGYSPERTKALYERIEEALSAYPGIGQVASASIPVVAGNNFGLTTLVEGFERSGEQVPVDAVANIVGTGFFETLSIGLLAGREFSNDDLSGPLHVAIVNERFARAYGLGDSAVGKHLMFGPDERLEIVGVVADAAYSDIKADIPPQVFLPQTLDVTGPLSNLLSFFGTSSTFYVRATIDPDALLLAIPSIVARVDPTLPVNNVITMRRQVQENVFVDRLVAILSGSFAALATLLAAIGLYGVLSYGIAQRTRELGLRLALGAEPFNLRAMVLRQVAILTMIGIALGATATIAFGRLAESLLYGLTGFDLRVLGAAAVVLSLIVLGAGYLPARRASRIAPMQALRHE
jgi:putative ABC transport system permease protein